MRYLITGGCGFVGCNIAAHLIRSGHQAIVLDNLSRSGSAENLEWLRSLGSFEIQLRDTRDAAALAETVRKARPAAIFHLAGQVAMTTSLRSPRLDFETNVAGSINLLEAVREHWPESAVVYASSNKVYGALEEEALIEEPLRYALANGSAGIKESAALNFQTPYGCSKGAADQYMLDYARCFGLNTVVFRHSTIYGGRQFATFDQGWLGWFCRQAIECSREPSRAPMTINGNGKQVRDLLHSDDAVRCYLRAAEQIEKTRGKAFNIGGGLPNSMSLLELFAELERRFHIRMNYSRLPWRLSDQKFFVADYEKAHRTFGWRPEVSREEGLNRIIEWELSCAAA